MNEKKTYLGPNDASHRRFGPLSILLALDCGGGRWVIADTGWLRNKVRPKKKKKFWLVK